MIRTIIVDDEPLGRRGIKQLLAHHKDFEVIAEYEDGLTALQHIELLKPELIFMDVQMPEMDGFEVIQNLDVQPVPLIIFVTAYDEFALKAFQTHAVDYLLKPLSEESFVKSLERVRLLTLARTNSEYLRQLNELLTDVKKRVDFSERFIVRENNKLLLVPVKTIRIFEAKIDYVQIITTNQKYLIRETLTKLEQKLDPALFVRINRSTILRKSIILKLQPLSKGDYNVLLEDNKSYKLSRTYREKVLSALK